MFNIWTAILSACLFPCQCIHVAELRSDGSRACDLMCMNMCFPIISADSRAAGPGGTDDQDRTRRRLRIDDRGNQRTHAQRERGTSGQLRKRETKKHLVPGDTLGAIIARDAEGNTFRVGTGFSGDRRDALWADRDAIVGQLVKYKCAGRGS